MSLIRLSAAVAMMMMMMVRQTYSQGKTDIGLRYQTEARCWDGSERFRAQIGDGACKGL